MPTVVPVSSGQSSEAMAPTLPVPTPTPVTTLTTPLPSQPTVVPTASPQPPLTAGPATPLPDIAVSGWTFVNVQIYPNPYEEGVLLYGDAVNNTGTAQELDYIAGTFYDPAGQIIAAEEDTGDAWLLDVIPANGRMPFGFNIAGVENVTNLELNISAEPSNESPSQDFEFLELDSLIVAEKYCVSGQLQNPGNELEKYLVLVLVLYDEQDKMINFAEYPNPYFEELVGGETLPFEICVDAFKQNVADYEVRAWGQ
jgi:hypothetical protein